MGTPRVAGVEEQDRCRALPARTGLLSSPDSAYTLNLPVVLDWHWPSSVPALQPAHVTPKAGMEVNVAFEQGRIIGAMSHNGAGRTLGNYTPRSIPRPVPMTLPGR